MNTDIVDQMRLAERATRLLVAELRATGLDPTGIAATLCSAAGPLYRETLSGDDLRMVVLHAAECMITGRMQPQME
jgi:hypothetical protein